MRTHAPRRPNQLFVFVAKALCDRIGQERAKARSLGPTIDGDAIDGDAIDGGRSFFERAQEARA